MKHLTLLFVVLMGYSQIFSYAYLGSISSSTASIADGIRSIHVPLVNTNIFENAIIEKIGEENRDDHAALHIPARDHHSLATLFLPASRAELFALQTSRFNPYPHHSRAGTSYIRLRVFRI